MEGTLKVGDRVSTPENGAGVIKIIEGDIDCLVQHDKVNNSFHEGGAYALPKCTGWWYETKDLTLLKPPQFIRHPVEGDTAESIEAERCVLPSILPTDSIARKAVPITTGVLDYFPAAIAEVAKVSKAGNDQHNPGQPIHWARGKSTDHADTLVRHLLERGTLDADGMRHSAKVAWRALALLQDELEAEGAPNARGSW